MTAITPEDVLTGATPSAPRNAYYRERMDTTVETITRQLHEDRRLAHETKQADAAVQATMGLAKLHGLLVDRHEDISRSHANMTRAEIEAEIAKLERHLVEAKAQPGRPTFKLVST